MSEHEQTASAAPARRIAPHISIIPELSRDILNDDSITPREAQQLIMALRRKYAILFHKESRYHTKRARSQLNALRNDVDFQRIGSHLNISIDTGNAERQVGSLVKALRKQAKVAPSPRRVAPSSHDDLPPIRAANLWKRQCAQAAMRNAKQFGLNIPVIDPGKCIRSRFNYASYTSEKFDQPFAIHRTPSHTFSPPQWANFADLYFARRKNPSGSNRGCHRAVAFKVSDTWYVLDSQVGATGEKRWGSPHPIPLREYLNTLGKVFQPETQLVLVGAAYYHCDSTDLTQGRRQ